MTIVANANGTTTIYATTSMSAAAAGAMSPDALLGYCQMQLGSIDDETTRQINAQQLQLQERTAVENVQSTLQGYGTTGPSSPSDLLKCRDAFDQAIASLPAGDPVASQLSAQESTMMNKYFPPVNGDANVGSTVYDSKGNSETVGFGNVDVTLGLGGVSIDGGQCYKWNAPANNDWQGTTQGLSNLADNIKSNSEIQMLQLQDLVSQRQQVVQQMTGMMTKEDQTLEEGAKAIGQ